ncbi:MAG: ribulose-phosphate 3-epimerase [Chloroflexota bacterium]|nr:ribulose-phosphate 3-epimerase [Chloroflexota bacterium]
MVKLAPSILSADFGCLGEQLSEVVNAGADYIHIDVMDGQFVSSITVGSPVVKGLRPYTDVPFDVHLMVINPESQIPLFADAGADIITFHAEACPHIHRAVEQIKNLGLKAGVSLNPGTSLALIDAILPFVDIVLVMTVDPGYGGQPFIEGMIDKIADLRRRLDHIGSTAEIEVDGGITSEFAPKVVEAGATILVAGSAVFNSPLGVTKSIRQIRKSVA